MTEIEKIINEHYGDLKLDVVQALLVEAIETYIKKEVVKGKIEENKVYEGIFVAPPITAQKRIAELTKELNEQTN